MQDYKRGGKFYKYRTGGEDVAKMYRNAWGFLKKKFRPLTKGFKPKKFRQTLAKDFRAMF